MYGFVITRHVTSKQTNLYWIECCNCIRKLYPNSPILIVDDNSDQSFVSDISFPHTQIIQSEFKGRGEILGYYYFYTLRPFDTAIIIHDSVFIHNRIDFNDFDSVKILWSFNNCFRDDSNEEKFLLHLKDGNELVQFRKNLTWKGCFGSMAAIKLSFLENLQEKYNLFSLLEHIHSRNERYHLERIIGILCHKECLKLDSYFGDIHAYQTWGYSFLDYLFDNQDLPAIKVWTGR